ncbi:MAG: hypothetical protein KME38_04400 [Spirirestis rafaelensis WJT71-NPBG6]|nr:hypothetical protein [Spirirestis rafaelensis WJT71-NPBG6]
MTSIFELMPALTVALSTACYFCKFRPHTTAAVQHYQYGSLGNSAIARSI